MSISDCSSDVCSSELDLAIDPHLRRLSVAIIAVDAREVADLLLGDLISLVVEALLHALEKARAVDQLHLAAPFGRLPVGTEPQIGEDAGRSEARRVGTECVSQCRFRWAPEH